MSYSFGAIFQFAFKELNEVKLDKQTGWSTAHEMRAIDSLFHFWAEIDLLQPVSKIQNCVTHIVTNLHKNFTGDSRLVTGNAFLRQRHVSHSFSGFLFLWVP